MTTRRRFIAAGAAAVAAPAVARSQSSRTDYKLSVVGTRPIPLSIGAYRWAELVSERTQGRIAMKVHPGSSLVGGDQTRELVAMRQGVVDMTVSSTLYLSPQIREMNLFSLPFLMPDQKAFDAIINGEAGRELFKAMETRDVVPLAWGENGFRQLSNSKRAIRKPDDLKGLKIRYAAGPIFAEIFTALGASPVQMSFTDLQPALSGGAVDGQENPINLFLLFKLHALGQRQVTVWNYCADAAIFHVAKPVWETFSSADREILRESARQAAREQVAEVRKGVISPDLTSIDEARRLGVEVQLLSPEEKSVFQAATRSVFDKWAQQIGLELVTKAQKAIVART